MTIAEMWHDGDVIDRETIIETLTRHSVVDVDLLSCDPEDLDAFSDGYVKIWVTVVNQAGMRSKVEGLSRPEYAHAYQAR